MTGAEGDYTYIGDELELFAAATVWKSYLARQVSPFLGRRVLEVGAGLGGTTRLFCRDAAHFDRWLGLEPDPSLASRFAAEVDSGALPSCCAIQVGTLESLDEAEGAFDSILYIDVLEHIEHDQAEVARAAARLAPGGFLVVLSPAHNRLFTPFDKAIGHYRRYDRPMIRALDPPGLSLVRLRYLDSVGMLASAANRLILSQSMPTPRQIRFWDRVLVRSSLALDPLLAYRVGKSILAVWQRKPAE
jgi:SAM-dependent methyltransferase